MTSEEIAALGTRHGNAAAALVAAGVTYGESRLDISEHQAIANVCNFYLSAISREHALRDKFAGVAVQGLLAGMSSDPAALISGPEVVGTAYDIADCMLDYRRTNPPPAT